MKQQHGINLKDDLQDLGNAAKTIASDSLHSAQEKISGVYERGQDKIADLGSKLEDRTKKYPLQSLLIAAGVGFVLGLMKR